MKISLDWLSDFLPGPLAAPDLGDRLTHAGLPVEVIDTVGTDTVMDVEVTSNRSDCLSHAGVARELATLLDRAAKLPDPSPAESKTQTSSAIAVAIESPQLCPHYTARVIRGLKVGPSPEWLVRRLASVGVRAVNNVVDITNYVLFEFGQPLHAFDADKVGGSVVVRASKPGETIVSLDGHERKLTPGTCVITDGSKPIAIAGVMGGLDSEVTAGTTNVLLESARFDPLSIRQTARGLTMKSEASYRYERGIDPALPERAARRAAELILQLAGGELLAGVVQAGNSGAITSALSLRLSKLKSVLGVEIPKADATAALRRAHFSPTESADRINCVVPTFRQDVRIEVDLVEEVARVLGYDRIPVRDEISIRVAPPDDRLAAIDLIRQTLIGCGYFESWTSSFVPDVLAADFVPAGEPALPRVAPTVRKADGQLRPSILPGLLEAIRRNENVGVAGVKLFETGATFRSGANGAVIETTRVALAATGELRDLRGAIEVLLHRLDAHRSVRVAPNSQPGYESGAAGVVHWGDAAIGSIGLTSKSVAGKLSLREPPVIAELDMAALIAGTKLVPQQSPLPRFPAVRRDLSLIVADNVSFESITGAVRAATASDLEDIEYVTTYRGKPLEKGSKSVTLTLLFRSPTATLTGDAVETAVKAIIDSATTKVKATLRT